MIKYIRQFSLEFERLLKRFLDDKEDEYKLDKFLELSIKCDSYLLFASKLYDLKLRILKVHVESFRILSEDTKAITNINTIFDDMTNPLCRAYRQWTLFNKWSLSLQFACSLRALSALCTVHIANTWTQK